MINIGHLHPALVHLPIGVICLACLFYLFSRRFFSGVITPAVIRICLAIGILTAIPVFITGITQFWQDGLSLSEISLHVLFAVLTSLVSVGIYFIYPRHLNAVVHHLAFLVLFTCIVLTGHFGSNLTHGENYLTTFPSVQANASEEHHAAKPSSHVVEIKQMKFIPEVISVNPGDTVIFINKDFVPHNVVDDAGRWASPKLSASESWKLVVTSEATYHCSYHMVMKGQIKLASH